MKIAAAYIRVSDERQDEYSPDSQIKLIRDYAIKNEYIIPNDFVFYDDGISAKSTKKRNRFNDMIAFAEKKDHPFDAIIVWKFSRFARNEEDSILIKSRLRKNGVSVLSVSEPINEKDEYSGLIERFIEWDDAHYLRRLSQEVKRGMTEKASRGEPMSRQFGYDIVNKRLYPNKDADIVKGIFAAYTGGESIIAIARRLGNQGVRTFRGNIPDNRWVDYILHNPVYIGKIRWSTDGKAASMRDYSNPSIMIVDGSHEPIIDDETWAAAQKRIEDTKKAHGYYQRKDQNVEFMLKGLVRCSACGATLCRLSTACPSIQCHNYSRGKCRKSHSLSLAKATKAIIDALRNSVLHFDFNIVPTEPERKVEKIDYDKLIESEKHKLQKIKEAYMSGIDTIEEYAVQKKQLLRVIELIEADRDSHAAKVSEVDKAAYAEKVTSVLALLNDPNSSEKAKNIALRSILTGIVYEKQNDRLNLFFYN